MVWLLIKINVMFGGLALPMMKKKLKTWKKYQMLLILFLKLKKIFSYVLTLIQLAINFGCITIKQVIKRDLVLANGVILKFIFTNMIIEFVGMTNKWLIRYIDWEVQFLSGKKLTQSWISFSLFKNSWLVARYFSIWACDKSHFFKLF